MDFLEAGLLFPLNDDPNMIFRYYKLPLCCYSPSSMRVMVAFLSLIRRLGVPFSLSLFRNVYRLRLPKDQCWVTLVARPGYGVIRGIPKQDMAWKSRYLFLGVPANLSFPRFWVDIEGFKDPQPPTSEADGRSIKLITNAPLTEVQFDDLTSEAFLIRVGLLHPAQDTQRSHDGSHGGPSLVVVDDDNDGMGMIGSILDMANQNLRLSSKRGRSSEGGERLPSPPPTPGSTFPVDDEELLFSTHDSSFIPPFPMDPSRSYFNDGELSSRMGANLVTPADAKLLRNFEVKKHRAAILEYSTKVRPSELSSSLLSF